MLFGEVPFVQRFDAAASAGFGAVEFLWPAGIDLDALVAAKEAAGVDVALFNVDAGDMLKGDRGFPSDPSRREWWRERFDVALALAARLGCPRLNVLAGNVIDGMNREEQIQCLVDNLRWAIPQAEPAGVTLMLEALNSFEHPRYLFTRTDEVLDVLERIGSRTVKFQYDVYHMQRMEGNIVATLRRCIDRIGHIQIADSPERHEPGSGEINHRYILAEIERLPYEGYIGLEYSPSRSTEESLHWLPYSRREIATAADLHFDAQA
jgi:hydroxypyruvate isomerase